MSRRKTERLLHLVVLLLATRRYLTAEQIRQAVPGYPDSDEAFKRMFERDKEELRELGIPLEVGSDEDDTGYRIPPQAYELPDIHLTPDEVAVLGLAARVWQQTNLAEAASGALFKLRAAGIDADPSGSSVLEPRVGADEPAFPALYEAVRDRRVVEFAYKSMSGSGLQNRVVEPWGLASRRGRWYLVGHDRMRQAQRVFRLSRVQSEVVQRGAAGAVTVPDGVDIKKIAFEWGEPPAERRTAKVRLRRGGAQGVRRWASTVTFVDDEWDEAVLAVWDVDQFAATLARFAAEVHVIDPPDLRDAVIRQLKGVLA
ncbi:helix-turn-helix transcriptional regulator [Actinocorallia longicatena]|uniref:WYL domain-containing protein n=1 Tax=Actinocorallia longicatena TaxID=111803 RepID=A0ABP6Q8Q7_9ACTN